VMTDFRKPYEHFVPSDIHIQSKAKTYTVEGYNFSHTFGITLWIVSLSKIPY
jgi:IS1 family transposase